MGGRFPGFGAWPLYETGSANLDLQIFLCLLLIWNILALAYFFTKLKNTRSWKYIPDSTIEVQLPTQITEALHRFYLLEDILRHFRSSVLYSKLDHQVDCKFHIMKNDKRVRQENGKVFTSPLFCCQIITIIRRMITNMRTPVTAIQTT